MTPMPADRHPLSDEALLAIFEEAASDQPAEQVSEHGAGLAGAAAVRQAVIAGLAEVYDVGALLAASRTAYRLESDRVDEERRTRPHGTITVADMTRCEEAGIRAVAARLEARHAAEAVGYVGLLRRAQRYVRGRYIASGSPDDAALAAEIEAALASAPDTRIELEARLGRAQFAYEGEAAKPHGTVEDLERLQAAVTERNAAREALRALAAGGGGDE